MGAIIEREIRECATKQHKTVALFFPSLITNLCLVFGVRATVQDEHIKNPEAFNTRTIERIVRETAAAPLEPVIVTSIRRAIGVERRLQELSDSITSVLLYNNERITDFGHT